MKKLVCVVLAVLLLAGCAKPQTQAPAQEETPQETVFTPDYLVLPGDEPQDPQARL